MASDQDFVDYVLDQIAPDCAVTARKMFGEYGLYSDGVFFGMICDNRCFVKPTPGGRAHMGRVVEGEPYPGARPALLVQEWLDDASWLSEMVRVTVRELPPPRKKGKR